MCGVITSVDQCALRARSTHDVHHAIVGVNVVIGVLVVLCELHVIVRVHVIPLCDDAVVRRTLGLIVLVVIVVFVVAIFNRILLYGRYTLYMFEHTFTENVISQETIMEPCESSFDASPFQIMGQMIFCGHEVFPS